MPVHLEAVLGGVLQLQDFDALVVKLFDVSALFADHMVVMVVTHHMFVDLLSHARVEGLNEAAALKQIQGAVDRSPGYREPLVVKVSQPAKEGLSGKVVVGTKDALKYPSALTCETLALLGEVLLEPPLNGCVSHVLGQTFDSWAFLWVSDWTSSGSSSRAYSSPDLPW